MELFQREIPIYKNVFCSDIDREYEKELILPDYCPDIVRIIRMDATPYVENKTYNNEICTVSGTYVYSLLYESEYDSSLAYATFTVPFEEKIDIKEYGKENEISAKITTKRIGCKLINARKISVRTKSIMSLTVKAINRVSVIDTASLPENIFIQKEPITWYETEKEKKYTFNFEESFTLSEKSTPIDEKIMVDLSAEQAEYTFHADTIKLKSAVICKIIYKGEDSDRYIMLTRTFPNEMTIDDVTFTEDSIIRPEISVSNFDIITEVDPYGENRVVNINYTLSIKLCIKEKQTFEYATDAFTAGAESTVKKSSFSTQKNASSFSKAFTVENKFMPENIRFTEILDSNAKIIDCKVKITDDGIIISGVYNYSVLGTTENSYKCVDLTGEFLEKISQDRYKCEYSTHNCRILESDYSLSADGSINIRLKISCDIETESIVTFNAVTNIEVNENVQEKVGCLIFCYPAGDDSLWSIAKKYCVAPTEISEGNPDSFSPDGELIVKAPIRIIK